MSPGASDRLQLQNTPSDRDINAKAPSRRDAKNAFGNKRNSFELGVLTFLFCLASLRLGAFSVIYPVVFGALVPVEGIAHSTGWVVVTHYS